MSYKVEVIADDSGQWVGNQMTFPTKEEAEEYAKNLAWRWTAVREWRVVPATPPPGTTYRDPALGADDPVGRYKTRSQEKAEEKRAVDVPLIKNFKPGQKVTVSQAWRRHWTWKEVPPPTRSLWSKLFSEVGVVSGVDDFGNVYVQDRFDQFHGREGFPVPARFVRPA